MSAWSFEIWNAIETNYFAKSKSDYCKAIELRSRAFLEHRTDQRTTSDAPTPEWQSEEAPTPVRRPEEAPSCWGCNEHDFGQTTTWHFATTLLYGGAKGSFRRKIQWGTPSPIGQSRHQSRSWQQRREGYCRMPAIRLVTRLEVKLQEETFFLLFGLIGPPRDTLLLITR
jgi:hypothetical protein